MGIYEFISKLWSVKLNGHWFEKIDSQIVSHKVRTESYSNKISPKFLMTSEDTAGELRSIYIYAHCVCIYHFIKSVVIIAKTISIREQQGKNTYALAEDLLKVQCKHLPLTVIHHRNIYSMFKYKAFFFNVIGLHGNVLVLAKSLLGKYLSVHLSVCLL